MLSTTVYWYEWIYDYFLKGRFLGFLEIGQIDIAPVIVIPFSM